MDASVHGLSNDELKYMLQRFGYEAGPIVGTTRRVYENKLVAFLRESGDSPFDLRGGDATPSSQQRSPLTNGSPMSAGAADYGDDVVVVGDLRGYDVSPTVGISPRRNDSPIGRRSPGKSPLISGSPIRSMVTPELLRENFDQSPEDDDRMEGEERFRFVGPPSFELTLPEPTFGSSTQIRQRSTVGGSQLYPDLYGGKNDAAFDRDYGSRFDRDRDDDYSKPTDHRASLAARTAVPRNVYGASSSSAGGAAVVGGSKYRWSIWLKIFACLIVTIFFVMLARRLFEDGGVGSGHKSKVFEFDE